MAKAGKMLRANQKWREEHRIDFILQEYKVPEVLSAKYNPIGIIGHDKSLNPGMRSTERFVYCCHNFFNDVFPHI